MKFDEGWVNFFAQQVVNPQFQKAANDVQSRRTAGVTVYPDEGRVFDAFALTPFENLKAVIMVEEPYSDPKLAGSGLALSVSADVPIPPVLMNVFTELRRDLGVPIPSSGDLTSWAESGILVCSSILTVEKGKQRSHKNVGWDSFTENMVRYISAEKEGIVFALWGTRAGKNAHYIDSSKHTVLTTSLPSRPLEGFSGCGHFKRINEVGKLWNV